MTGKGNASNLAKYWKENPSGPSLRHGAYSQHFRKRYSDARTTEGRQLRAVINGLIADLGGNPNLTAGQLLILDRIKEKLVVLMQIGQYVDMQPSAVTDGGELLPCLGRNYTSFSEAVRRDILAVYEMAARKPSRTPSLEEYLKQRSKEKGATSGNKN